MGEKEINLIIATKVVKFGFIMGVIVISLFVFVFFAGGWSLTRQQRIFLYLVALILQVTLLIYGIFYLIRLYFLRKRMLVDSSSVSSTGR